MTALRAKIIDQFQDSVPNTLDYNAGYFEGQQQSRNVARNKRRPCSMYTKHPSGDFTFWCDGRYCESETVEDGRGKRKRDLAGSKRQTGKEEVDSLFKNLKEKHGSSYETPKLRLWAQMVTSNLHDDLDSPPQIPAFTGTASKRRRVSDALSGAAVAFAKVFSGEEPNTCQSSNGQTHSSSNSTKFGSFSWKGV